VRCWTRSHRVSLATAFTIIVMLLLCPAVTRVAHVQPLTGPTSYVPSFQRSLDVPPEPHLASRDVTIVPVPLVALTTTCVITSWPWPTDDALTWSFFGTRTRPLRAPPVRLF
jgi:hypothetical protein